MPDLTGRSFGNWVVWCRVPAPGKAKYKCACTCGTVSEVFACNLVGGKSTACKRCRSSHSNRKHGHNRVGAVSPTYDSWRAMLLHCTQPTFKQWADYGGRGIGVCVRWHYFENFLADMGPRPAGHTLDRYPNNNGNYEPGNCRWATPDEQANNQRKRKVC